MYLECLFTSRHSNGSAVHGCEQEEQTLPHMVAEDSFALVGRCEMRGFKVCTEPIRARAKTLRSQNVHLPLAGCRLSADAAGSWRLRSTQGYANRTRTRAPIESKVVGAFAIVLGAYSSLPRIPRMKCSRCEPSRSQVWHLFSRRLSRYQPGSWRSITAFRVLPIY